MDFLNGSNDFFVCFFKEYNNGNLVQLFQDTLLANLYQ